MRISMFRSDPTNTYIETAMRDCLLTLYGCFDVCVYFKRKTSTRLAIHRSAKLCCYLAFWDVIKMGKWNEERSYVVVAASSMLFKCNIFVLFSLTHSVRCCITIASHDSIVCSRDLSLHECIHLLQLKLLSSFAAITIFVISMKWRAYKYCQLTSIHISQAISRRWRRRKKCIVTKDEDEDEAMTAEKTKK